MRIFFKMLSIISYLIVFVSTNSYSQVETIQWDSIEIGAEQVDQYLPLLTNKKIGVVANHTSYVGNMHLLDFLIEKHCKVNKIFSMEHGFRGDKSSLEGFLCLP